MRSGILRRAETRESRERAYPRTGKGPALISSVLLCSALAATESLRILLGRPGLKTVPRIYYFDPVGHRVFTSRARRNRWIDHLLRKIGMKRFPGLLSLHEEELSLRTKR